MNTRTLGKSNIALSPLGFGSWAIGGPFWLDGLPDGWGEVDDQESIRAIHAALTHGITLFDTADVYGTGHSEEVIGRALKGRRHEAVIATKFGYRFDAETKQAYSNIDLSPSYVRSACEASLRRLATDYIDLYQIHVGDISNELMSSLTDTLDRLKLAGWIREYGFSTWDTDRAERFAQLSSVAAIQHSLNVLQDQPELIEVCERHQLISMNNSPLAMGLLSGKFHSNSQLPSNDVRGSKHDWVQYFKNGKPRMRFLVILEAIRDILTSDNRSLVQGALAWIWGRSELTVPIPGLRTVAQVEEAARAMDFGPLSDQQIMEIDGILKQYAMNEAL